MKLLRAVTLLFVLAAVAPAKAPVTAAAVAESLSQIKLDPNETYHVRDLQIRRGGITFYFTDGLLSFATEIEGRRVAAVFTTSGIEAGDGEVLLLPPQAAERQSLAAFARSPNVDEHFRTVILYFTDRTADELLTSIAKAEAPKASSIDPRLQSAVEHILQHVSAQVRTRMVARILDPGALQYGFFYASIEGVHIGSFDFVYNPELSEPVTVGRISDTATPLLPRFELWTNYRPQNSTPFTDANPVLTEYSIDAAVQADLSISVAAKFDLKMSELPQRVVALNLSQRLHVTAASVDGRPVEVFQRLEDVPDSFNSDGEFLLVNDRPLDPAQTHHIEVRYAGAIISQMAQASYLVSERNLWYPHTPAMFTRFDISMHCPQRSEIVSSGDIVSETVESGTRTVHRRTASPQQIVGFNLGEYLEQKVEAPPYRIRSYEEKDLHEDSNGIAGQAAEILRYYSRQWLDLPEHTLSVTPVPGEFGQGFPGLIYLAHAAYLADERRAPMERGEQSKIFFSDLLLPHEIAHQWWGNLVTTESYRSEWLMEAMANESALMFMAAKGAGAQAQAVLEQYLADLEAPLNGKTVEASGPLNFGTRLTTTAGLPAWQTIIYKKGTFVLEMLRARMGNQNFLKMQADLLRSFAGKPVRNEDFQRVASRYLPANQPDRSLQLFFDTWVYATGVPKISISRAGTKVQVSGVDEAFSADLPLRCPGKTGLEQTRWLRIEAGQNVTLAPGCKLPFQREFLYYKQ